MANLTPGYTRSYKSCVLLLEKHNDYYERIGIFWIHDDIFAPRTDLERYYFVTPHTICDQDLNHVKLSD